jgi:cytidyltransferase-like protein
MYRLRGLQWVSTGTSEEHRRQAHTILQWIDSRVIPDDAGEKMQKQVIIEWSRPPSDTEESKWVKVTTGHGDSLAVVWVPLWLSMWADIYRLLFVHGEVEQRWKGVEVDVCLRYDCEKGNGDEEIFAVDDEYSTLLVSSGNCRYAIPESLFRHVCEMSASQLRSMSFGGFHNQFDRTVLGGTFDHLHAGHKVMLTMAVHITRQVLVVAVTDDQLLAGKKFKDQLESLDARMNNVRKFIQVLRKPVLELDMCTLSDPFGPSVSRPELQAVIFTAETTINGMKINPLREERGFNPLAVVVSPLVVLDIDQQQAEQIVDEAMRPKISSTWLRQRIAGNSS